MYVKFCCSSSQEILCRPYWFTSNYISHEHFCPTKFKFLLKVSREFSRIKHSIRSRTQMTVTKFNPFFALDIFICSFRKCIQHTTRGQSNFSWSKLCCCYIFIVLKYWWQNSITAHIYVNSDQGLVTRWVKKVQKEGKRSSEGFRGIIILLILAKVQSLSLGQALRLGQACQLPGPHSSLR